MSEVTLRISFGVADGSASGNVWRSGGIAGAGLLDDDGIASLGHFNPAFFGISFNVPGASSLPRRRNRQWLLRVPEVR